MKRTLFICIFLCGLLAVMAHYPMNLVVEEKSLPMVNDNDTAGLSTKFDDVQTLGEVVVAASGVSRIKKTAFNALALDAKELGNTSKNLADAINKLPGMKLRESGGVGSDMQLMLDGFSGKHVKVFIDGMPQEGSGSGFDLNNLPINFAERIEVYKGVVPVGFGTDAIGGVINIVTRHNQPRWFVDASYTFGSFNTHKSHIHAGRRLKNGFVYELNAFQNYSDNNYQVRTYVQEFGENGFMPPLDMNKLYDVRRFNDSFHNEQVSGKLGWTGVKWADRLMFTFTFSNYYKEIQTGVRQDYVFGDKHRKGWTVTPKVEYKKRNFLVQGLELNLAANYHYSLVHNVDTSMYAYNWFGQRRLDKTRGEQSLQDNQAKSNNWNATVMLNYCLGEAHTLTLSEVMSGFRRTTRSRVDATSRLTDYSSPQVTRKNIVGLSYRYMSSEKWNAIVFAKHYHQYNKGTVSRDVSGIGNWADTVTSVSTFGYGGAATWFPLEDLQLKFSYEKAYRLPTTNELFGDMDLEAGSAKLRSENSDNLNLNLSYTWQIIKHHRFLVDGSLIYRHTKDYIQRVIDESLGMGFARYENHGKVITTGYNVSARYSWRNKLHIGGTYNRMSARDRVKYLSQQTKQINLHYGDRIPNQPFEFANFDASYRINGVGGKRNWLTADYEMYYQTKFPLLWESIGDSKTKHYVPTQWSHNAMLSYVIDGGKYNVSVEARNLFDQILYDNYSLQKAGRAFYLKFRINLNS